MKTQNDWNDLASEIIRIINSDPRFYNQTIHMFNIRNRILYLYWKNRKWVFNWIDPIQLPIEHIVDLKELGFSV